MVAGASLNYGMKFLPVFLLGAILSFGGCKPRRLAESTPPPTTPETPPVETASIPPAPPANTPTLAGPTKEQAASTVRVRVASGGLPPQDFTGALLHRDELSIHRSHYGHI